MMVKNRWLILVFVVLVNFMNAQVTLKQKEASMVDTVYSQPRNCSPRTAMLIKSWEENKSNDYLEEHFNTFLIDDVPYVGAFIKTSNNFNRSMLANLDIRLNTKAGQFFTSQIPVDHLEDILSINEVKYVDISLKGKIQLNQALVQTNVNLVHNGNNLDQSYTGEDVIVGVIDKGFDYTHPTFYDAGYNEYRISRVWEQEQNGTPPTNFNYGDEILGETNLLNDANDGMDKGSHGTHVTGIAAGSGSDYNFSYRGVAYESEIVAVSTDFTTTGIADGIAYIFDYANTVDKPAVANMSLGYNIGPHDGTSPFDLFCDNLVDDGNILISSAGNEAGKKLHLNYNFSVDESIYSFAEFPQSNNTSNGASIIDIWGETNSNFEISVGVYNIDDDEYEDYTTYISTTTDGTYDIDLQDGDFLFSDVVPLDISVENSNPNNGKPHVQIFFNNTSQNESQDIYDYIILEVKGSNTSFDAWCSDCEFTNFNAQFPIINGDDSSSITEIGGTGNSIISVGAYNSKTIYADLQGNLWNNGQQQGDIAPFSSLGPTVDGRTKPDISAPGYYVASSVSSFDNEISDNKIVAEVSKGNNNWPFAVSQGTSMASPMVAGIVALWLEADPTLSLTEIKQLLQNHSITDNYTGTAPNNTWGQGKVDALQALQAIEASMDINNSVKDDDIYVYPNPTNGICHLNLKDHKFNNLRIYNMSGELVHKEKINDDYGISRKRLNLSKLSNGIYLLKLSSNTKTKQLKLMIN